MTCRAEATERMPAEPLAGTFVDSGACHSLREQGKRSRFAEEGKLGCKPVHHEVPVEPLSGVVHFKTLRIYLVLGKTTLG